MADDSGIRIDRWLRRKFFSLPQSFFEKNLRKGFIRLNKKIVKSNKKVVLNDTIEIYDFNEKVYNITKKHKNFNPPKNLINKFDYSIIFEDNNYLVINKWRGIATQGGSNITNSIDQIIKSLSVNMSLVHRLDRDTSGALLISKNYRTSRFFGKLFSERKIYKMYIAICNGCPIRHKGTIELDIKKKKINNFQDNYNKTITNYELIECKNNISSIIFLPMTGKMHQIRIVAKHLGCSILGDKKYGNLKRINKDKIIKEKLMLHALGISFFIENIKKIYFAELNKDMVNNFKKFGLKIPKKNIIEKYI